MNLLAFDTSTETLSVALACAPAAPAPGAARLWEHTGAGGAQASATLIPVVLDLLAQAGLRMSDLQAIAFGRGPGSFTGLRTACSVAQGLAFGAGVPVLPVDTLLAVAEDARHRHGATRVVAALDARMDELYAAWYAYDAGQWRQQGDFGLLAPQALVVGPGWQLAGNVGAAYGERLAAANPGLPAANPCLPALPTAAALLRLAPALLAAGQAVAPSLALPLYVRDKVAQTTAERAAVHATAQAAQAAPQAAAPAA